jgi:hypothetical protein
MQVKDKAVAELSRRLRADVRMSKVGIRWLNRLELRDVSIDERGGASLLEARRLIVDLKLLPLLKGKIVLTTLRLFDFSLHISKTTPHSPLNLQFIIDTFAKKDTADKPSNISLNIQSVLIRKGRISYDIFSENATPGVFNASHIKVSEISGHISLDVFDADSLNLRIRRLALNEGSGLQVKSVALRLAGNRDSLIMDELEVELPRSVVRIGQAGLAFNRATADKAASFHVSIANSAICPQDLSPFLPALRNYDERLRLSALVEGTTDDINLRSLSIRSGDRLILEGQMTLGNLCNASKLMIDGTVERLHATTDGLRELTGCFGSSASLPPIVERLGTVNFDGHVSGLPDDILAEGKISSAIGSLEAKLKIGRKATGDGLALAGTLSSSELNVNEMFDAGNPFGSARFSLAIDAVSAGKNSFAGTLDARVNEFDYRNYRYENLRLNGRFRPGGFTGKVELDDPNCSLTAEGMYSNDAQSSVIDFFARLNHLKPDNLNLWDKLEAPDFSASVRASFRGKNVDDMNGSITVDSLLIHTEPSDFLLRQLNIASSADEYGKRLIIKSDIINGELSGIYSFSTLIPGLAGTFRQYLPSVVNLTAGKERAVKENNFSLAFIIDSVQSLASTLKLPFSLDGPAKIMGYYNNTFDKFKLEASVPGLTLGNTLVRDCRLTCENPSEHILLSLDAVGIAKNSRNRISLSSTVRNNRIESSLQWENDKERVFKADISASTLFTEAKDAAGKPALHTNIHINKSPLILNDSIWQIREADVDIDGNRICIRNLAISGNDRLLHIDGAISDNEDDTLALTLNRIELSYIFDILNIPILEFGGEATGRFQASDLYKSRMIKTDLLTVHDFSFNHVTVGRLDIKSHWDDMQQGILLNGNIIDGDSASTAVNGYIYPIGEKEGLDIRFNASKLNLAFLNKYMKSVISDFKGRGTGNIRIYGSFDDVDLEGEAFVDGAGMGIDFLNTYYTLADSVHIDKGHISLNNSILRDAYGNKAKVKEAHIYHNYFHDISFSAEITDIANMLVYNATERQNPMLYGKVFASGNLRMSGNESLVDFNISLRSQPGTAVGLNFMGNSTATAYNFITFVNRNSTPTMPGQTIPKATDEDDTETEIRMKLLVEVTPDANMEVVMDPASGDMIKGAAAGDLRIEYGTRSDLRVYGALNINKGYYNFSLQQFIRKNFDIREESTVNFTGDPDQAQLNIYALHNLTANIGDLDPSLLGETPRTNISVNCILHIQGAIHHPTLSFDLELPGSNSDLERKVRSYINTEDMLMRQIVYLLALNTFHPSNFAQGPLRSNEVSAMTSAAISAQLSTLLSAITDKVKIGTNIRANQERFDETEVDMLLSSQLFNNRLLFNGNFGYKNNLNVKNVFVGEFDLEYLLTRNGEFRLKAYNHANDMYRYLKQSLTTQGFGFMYKKDFSSLADLLGIKN